MTCNQNVRIDVLICTFRRASIEQTLRSIDAQDLPPGVSVRMIVADNDDTPSARPAIMQLAAAMKSPVTYAHAPARNISIARNRCLDIADADWIAFIDDDERADANWLIKLYHCATQGGYDAVFGPAFAEYDSHAPEWIRGFDYHSNRPLRRGNEVQTGHTCNALMRWRGGRFVNERFLIEKGRSGGEDTEFFFRLWRSGAKFGLCEDAQVFEAVDPARLNFEWLRQRKFRAGQSYGRHVASAPAMSAWLALSACAKIALCSAMAAFSCFSTPHRRFWFLRGAFHSGVLTAQFGLRENALYGE